MDNKERRVVRKYDPRFFKPEAHSNVHFSKIRLNRLTDEQRDILRRYWERTGTAINPDNLSPKDTDELSKLRDNAIAVLESIKSDQTPNTPPGK